VQRSKTAPKGAAIFVAACLTREPALINDYHAAAVTTDLLGIESSSTLVVTFSGVVL
jgi:ParB family transcriptional regulator, chromosome partitioning protein